MDDDDHDRVPAGRPAPEDLEFDFPCGEWVGYWLQPERHWQEMRLTFRDARLTGTGRDGIGRFVIRGRYDRESREVTWTKSYVGLHSVFYRGFREAKGIWGVWDIRSLARGGFHIWPRSEGAGEAEQLGTATRRETSSGLVVGGPHTGAGQDLDLP